MSKLIPVRWLSNSGIGSIFEDMYPGYDYDDFPGSKFGSGRVADLYVGESHFSSERSHWVAQIWTNDKDGCDIIYNENTEDPVSYTRAALFARLFHHDNKSASEAYDFIVKDFRAQSRDVSDLSTVTGEPRSGKTTSTKKALPKKQL